MGKFQISPTSFGNQTTQGLWSQRLWHHVARIFAKQGKFRLHARKFLSNIGNECIYIDGTKKAIHRCNNC